MKNYLMLMPLILLGGLLLAGCISGQSGQSGVYGVVLAGPQCPAEKPGDPACAPKPISTTVLVQSEDGSKTQFTSDANGNFKVFLEPGTYLFTSDSQIGGIHQTVTVQDQYSQITVYYDTGIR